MVRILLIVFFSFSLSSCTFLQRVHEAETTNQGGYADDVIDRNFYLANTHEMRIFRAYSILTSLATIADDIGLSKTTREIVALQVRNTAKAIQNAESCIQVEDNDDEGVCIFFDTKMVDVSRSLFNLVKTILPLEELQQFIRDPKNVVSAASALTKLTDIAIPTALRAYAMYRDIWYINYLVYHDYLTDVIEEADQNNGAALLDAQGMKNALEKAYAENIQSVVLLIQGRSGGKKLDDEVVDANDKALRTKFRQLSKIIVPNETFKKALMQRIKGKCLDLIGDQTSTECNAIVQ